VIGADAARELAPTTALVLAADRGEGFRVPKYVVPVSGTPLLLRVLADVTTWPVDEVVVVLGAEAERILGALEGMEVTVVVDEEWPEGMAAPLRAGLDTIWRQGRARRVVLAHGDQPGIDAGVVAALLAEHRSPETIVAPKYRYALGWPIVVGRDRFPRLMSLEGDVDLLEVLTSHHEPLVEVWMDRLAPARVRTPEDLPSPRR